MMSKKAKTIAAMGLMIIAVATGFFLDIFLASYPIGGEQVETFVGGPNMKEAGDNLTDKEEMLYQYAKSHHSLVKMYFLDVTGDSENELLVFEEARLKGRDAHKITLLGINSEEEVEILVSWTVMYGSDIGRIAIYLHMEEDGSYTILEDVSVGGRREQPDELEYCRYTFNLSEEGFKKEILESAKGLAKERKEEFLRMEELINESITLYDTLPSAKLTKGMIE